MARIAGVDLPRGKRVEIALTYIYGIGRSRANKILAATVAANGVDFFEPLKPALPELDQTMALPWLSEIVISVLLKVAFTCAMPSASTARLRAFGRAVLAAVFGFGFGLGLATASSSLAACETIVARSEREPRLGCYFFGAFFFPAIARREPLCVRAFVCVR